MRNTSLLSLCFVILFVQNYYSLLQTVVMLNSRRDTGPWGPLYLASIWGKRTRIVHRQLLNGPCLEVVHITLGLLVVCFVLFCFKFISFEGEGERIPSKLCILSAEPES